MNRRWIPPCLATAAVLALCCAVPPACAWHTEGHRFATEAAVARLPATVPEFFRQGARAVGHGAIDPDLMKLRSLPQLRDGESPEHYLDSELLGGRALPETRYEYLEWLGWWARDPLPIGGRAKRPNEVGLLPYALVEGTQRLTVVFAEHRRWPDDPHIRAKTLVYAGLLAHYAGDLCQPLHTTIHHNGRALADRSSPRTGIHDKVDSLFERLGFETNAELEDVSPVAFEAVFPAVLEEFATSHALVERIYELEQELGSAEQSEVPEAVREFASDRYRAAVRFIASLFLTAWEDSAEVELPSWLDREAG